ncbi:alkaline phosphatase [Thalassotalea insulae]|uniref:Alkaline phosphatase n=1 Tax=Thalassotalea insulae TaxID=2056778 RepID=A0ABQ6GWT2_9GAMM|nr:alkaline phosphatase [Thalassotalea insulae]GLX80129.1 alkaline phosphatase [Thalassotalea insulae]
MNKPSILLSLACLAACTSTIAEKHVAQTSVNQPKNIIMIVSDGMGPAYTSAYRYFSDDPATSAIETTVFDRHLVGSATTYPAPVSGYVTDSAAAATALATGVKTYNGAIGVDVNKKPLTSVLQAAKNAGKKTGVVVTSQVNHATPASYISHNESRNNYNALANSYIDNGINTDVLFGGGWKFFIREDRNIVKEYQAAGFQYINSYQQLDSLQPNKAVIGLFADVGLPYAIDDTNSYRLSAMTKAAIKQLENDNGYFMLIEASQVDWAAHSNDINSAMREVKDLAVTLEYLETYVNQHPDTLVVVTADHSTGGFTIGANGVYQWRPQLLRKMTQSTYAIAQYFSKHTITQQKLSEMFAGEELQSEDINEINHAKSAAEKALANYLTLSKEQQAEKRQPDVVKALYQALNKLVDKHTNTGWTSHGHTAVDVPVFAFGAQQQQFTGSINNTDIAKNIFALLAK